MIILLPDLCLAIALFLDQIGIMAMDAAFNGEAKRPGWCRRLLWAGLLVIIGGLFLPEHMATPVQGATSADWNHTTFWHHPWGASVTHKGIDIFANKGRPALSASHGIVVFRGTLGRGGQVVIALGPKWRFHYYAHLNRMDVGLGQWLAPGALIGTVGDSGNAAGKPAHLHYSIFTPIPYPWLYQSGPQGFLRPFFLNPHEALSAL